MGRVESDAEKLDRNWGDLLQELRVCQTGTQLIAGFLLTLPFSSRFPELDPFGVRIYLALVLIAVVTAGLTLTPISIHRRLFGRQVKDLTVRSTHRLLQVVLGLIALLITGIALLIFDFLVGRGAALGVFGGLALLLLVLMVGLPNALSRMRSNGSDTSSVHDPDEETR